VRICFLIFKYLYQYAEIISLKIENRLCRKRGKSGGIIILAYHDVGYLPDDLQRNYIFNVHPDQFARQMEILSEEKISVISLNEAIEKMKYDELLEDLFLVITFDDGYHQFVDYALPILERYNFPATIFITTGFLDRKEPFPWLNENYSFNLPVEAWYPLTFNDLKLLSQHPGIEIGSHSHNHLNLKKVSVDIFLEDVVRSLKILKETVGKAVQFFSYPFSFFGSKNSWLMEQTMIEEELKKMGIKGICTTQIGVNRPNTNPFALKRIQIKNYDDEEIFRARTSGNLKILEKLQHFFRLISD